VNVIEKKKHLFLQSQDVGIKVWILNPEMLLQAIGHQILDFEQNYCRFSFAY
jgi:hypothetical protein